MIFPPRFEVPLGAVDGLNVVFTVSTPYVSGSIEVFLNGQAKRADWADGWTELGGNRIALKKAPEVGDVLQVYFRPA